MLRLLILITRAAVGLLVCTACTVYTPMQPHAPFIRAKGDGEVSVQVQPTLRPELSVAYSPLNHIVVMGASSWRPPLALTKDKKSDGFRVAQYEVSVGAHQAIGHNWTGMVAAGAGQAYVQRNVSDGPFSFNSDYQSHYGKQFGQISLCHQYKTETWGLGFRMTRVSFQDLSATDRGTGKLTTYVLPSSQQWRYEPFAYVRETFGGPQGHWQLQVSAAFSFCQPNRETAAPDLDEYQFRQQYNRGNALLMGMGMTYLIGRRPE
jgi:hypothetical protein